MKTYVTTILTISLFFVISCQKGKQEKSPEPGITEWQPAYLALGENITEQERLSFCFKNEEKSVPPLNRIYPEHFGGIYRCPSDRTKTVICLTDTSEQTKQHIIDLCQLSREGYVFQKCDFSKNEMLQIMRKLNDIPNLYEEWSIIDIGISSQKNKVDIHFYGQYDEDKINSFQEKVLNHPALLFTFAHDEDTASSLPPDYATIATKQLNNIATATDSSISLAGGARFVTDAKNKGCIGITAYLGDTQGFITAKHVVKRTNTRIHTYKDEENLGTLFGNCTKISPVTDVAFCSLYSNAAITIQYHRAYHAEPLEPSSILIISEDGHRPAFVTRDVTMTTIDGERVFCHKFEIGALTLAGLKGGNSGALILDDRDYAGGIVIGVDPGSLKNGSYYQGYFIGGTECVRCLGLELR